MIPENIPTAPCGLNRKQADSLLNNFNCCFIHNGEKRPMGDDWQNNPRSSGEWTGQGIGVICGQRGELAIHALDFDIRDEELAKDMAVYLQGYLLQTDKAILFRVGQAPKFLIPFVMDEQISKSEFTSAKYRPEGEMPTKDNTSQLEVLGTGNQFIAYAIHPDTKRPYEWQRLLPSDYDSLYQVAPEQLLKLTRDELGDIKKHFERLAVKHGLVTKGKPAVSPARPAPARPTPATPCKTGGYELYEVLPYLENNGVDYDVWISIGAAIKAEGGSYEDWFSFSRQSEKHDEAEMPKKWASFTPMLGGVGMGTLAMYALQNGMPARGHEENLRSYAEILDDAGQLDEESEPETIEALVAETLHLTPAQRRKVHDRIKKSAKMPLSVLSEILDEFRGSNHRDDEPDELTLARKVIDNIGEQNILSALESVWEWDKAGKWRQLDDRTVKKLTQDRLPGEVDAVSARLVGAVSDLMRTEVHKPFHEFNVGEPETVNCTNGELVLVNGQWVLSPHCREHYRTAQIPVAYDPAATAPKFQRFLEQIFNDDADAHDKIRALLEITGYTLMAHCRHEKFVILVGSGANGKSVYLAILEALCGSESVAGVQPSQFDNKFQRAHLHMKLANIVTEIKQGEVIDDASLKGIVSGEPTTVEHKHKNPFVMRPFSTCWFGTNHMPHTRDFSEALFRRAVVLTFNQVFKPELGNCDPNLKDKLMTELSGVLNLSLQAYADALQHGFTMPASSVEARNEWRLEADQVAQFVDEECERSSFENTPIAQLYKSYESWAMETGINKRLTQKSVRTRLNSLGFGYKHTNYARLVTGISLKKVRG
jgi:putative DNA primase/helicase